MKKLFTILLAIVLVATLGFAIACQSHNWAEDWSSDKDNHWHACLDEGCGETSDKAPHVDENNDKVCDVCQYKMGEDPQPQPTMYALTYSANGGSGAAPATEQVAEGAEVTLKANMFTAPEGKEFDGWLVDGTKKAAGDKITMPAKALTVTAQWKDKEVPQPKKYSLMYAANGGSGKAPAAEQYEEGAKVTLLAADTFTAPESKEFDGWLIEGTKLAAGAEYTMPAKAVVITAQWKDKAQVTPEVTLESITATYYGTIQVGAELNKTKLVVMAHYSDSSKNTTVKDYTLGAIDTATAGEKSVTITYTEGGITKECTVKITVVESQPTTYALTYDAGEGSGEAPAAEQVAAGTEITLKANMFTAPEGKEFDGWMVDGVKKAAGDKVTMPAKALTITAQWKDMPQPTKYALTYDAGEGSGEAPAAEQLIEGAKITLKAADTFTAPNGKEFDGWLIDGEKLEAGAEYTMPAKAVTAIAQWKTSEPQPEAPAITAAANISIEHKGETTTGWLVLYADGTGMIIVENKDAEENDPPVLYDKSLTYTINSQGVLTINSDNEDCTITVPATGSIVGHTVSITIKAAVGEAEYKFESEVYKLRVEYGFEYEIKEDTFVSVTENYIPVGQIADFTNIEREGYTIKAIKVNGVALPSVDAAKELAMPEEDVTIVYEWQEIVTVTFKNGDDTVKTVVLNKGDALTADDMPEDPEVDANKEFQGWFNGVTAIAVGVVVNEDITATAKIVDVYNYTINYYAPQVDSGETMYLYLYIGAKPVEGFDYATTTMSPVDGKDGWHTKSFKTYTELTTVNIIVHTQSESIKHEYTVTEGLAATSYLNDTTDSFYDSYEAAVEGYAEKVTYTINYYAPEWPEGKDVYVHTFDGLALGEWATVKMTAVTGQDGWYVREFKSSNTITGFGILFYTKDESIKHEFAVSGLTGADFYFVSNGHEAYADRAAAEAGYDENNKTPTPEYTFYYYAPNWPAGKEIYLYTYQGTLGEIGGYTDKTMEAVDGKTGWYSYTFETTNQVSNFGIIFHTEAAYGDDSVKHEFKVSGLTGNEFYFVSGSTVVYDSYEEATSGIDDDTEVWFTIYFYAPDFDNANVYTWGAYVSGGWAKVSMTAEYNEGEKTGWHSYSFKCSRADITTNGLNVICHNSLNGDERVEVHLINDPNALYFNISKGNQAFNSKEAALA